MAAASTTKQKPAWLAKHASFEYLTSVLDTLSQRETVRDAARYTSLQPSRSPDTLPATNYYSITHGLHIDNRNRNRYTDIIPYDRTRIRVPPVGQQATQNAEEPTNYLNASWVLERYGHKWWIASQAPLPHTAYTFLSIFLQPSTAPPEALFPNTPSDLRPKFGRIRTVVQLTQNLESGRRKAHAYFPDTVGPSLIVLPDNNTRDASNIHSSGLKATLIQVKNIAEANCVQSTISVSPVTFKDRRPNTSPGPSGVSNNVDFTVDDSATVTFQHLLFTAWPDHGVPTAKDRDSLLAFIRLVDQTNREIPPTTSPGEDIDPDPPIIVGCSAGIGRTGSFIALSSLLRAFDFLPPANAPTNASVVPTSPLGTLPKEFEEDMVALEIDLLREQRPRMVEREEQVECIYEVLASAFEAQGSSSG